MQRARAVPVRRLRYIGASLLDSLWMFIRVNGCWRGKSRVRSQAAKAALIGMALYARKMGKTIDELVVELLHKEKILRLVWEVAGEYQRTGEVHPELFDAFSTAILLDSAFSAKKVNFNGV